MWWSVQSNNNNNNNYLEILKINIIIIICIQKGGV
jgi:hypothetical protein